MDQPQYSTECGSDHKLYAHFEPKRDFATRGAPTFSHIAALGAAVQLVDENVVISSLLAIHFDGFVGQIQRVRASWAYKSQCQ